MKSMVATSTQRRMALLVLVALGIITHTLTTGRLRATTNTSRQASAMEMHVVSDAEEEAHQRAVDDAALRLSLQTNATLAPEVLERLVIREQVLQCLEERDYGMIEILRGDVHTLCDNATGVDAALGRLSTYHHYHSERASMRSTVVTNLWVDVRSAKVSKPIADVSQDGRRHDPRFQHDTVDAYCVCNANQDQSLAGAARVWGYIHGGHSWRDGDDWRYCKAVESSSQLEKLRSGFSSHPWNTSLLLQDNDTRIQAPPDPRGWPYTVHEVKRHAILMGRRDDHNPFFQIAATMNTWIMMQVLDWSPEQTQLVYFDDALPASTDELQRRMLAPKYPVVKGREIMGSVLHFDKALVAPFEYMGPMMRHLDDDEPCRANKLVQDFRALAMKQFGTVSQKKSPASCTITVITRRPYNGRMVQRKWLNEDTIVGRMRADYGEGYYQYGTCRIQSVNFVGLSLEQQMETIVESDVVIGMHGAGMVNVLWARPETYVVEIFPAHRFRWGYRNLCYFIGCKWSQFRGGQDTGKGNNNSDKVISYADWFAYFDPIVRSAVAELEARVAQSLP